MTDRRVIMAEELDELAADYNTESWTCQQVTRAARTIGRLEQQVEEMEPHAEIGRLVARLRCDCPNSAPGWNTPDAVARTSELRGSRD